MREIADELAPDPDGDGTEPVVLEPDADDTERVLDALGSATTRSVLWRLYESPATAVEIADENGYSVQNAHYHLQKLRSAGLVEVTETRYSEKGNEQDIFAPTSDPIVLAGADDTADRLRTTLDRGLALVVAVAVVVATTGAVELLATIPDGPAPPSGPAWPGATPGPTPAVGVTVVAAAVAATGGILLWRRRRD